MKYSAKTSCGFLIDLLPLFWNRRQMVETQRGSNSRSPYNRIISLKDTTYFICPWPDNHHCIHVFDNQPANYCIPVVFCDSLSMGPTTTKSVFGASRMATPDPSRTHTASISVMSCKQQPKTCQTNKKKLTTIRNICQQETISLEHYCQQQNFTWFECTTSDERISSWHSRYTMCDMKTFFLTSFSGSVSSSSCSSDCASLFSGSRGSGFG